MRDKGFGWLSIFNGAEHLVAGLGGGVIATVLLHPLDLLKIRFAVSDGSTTTVRPSYGGLRRAVSTIVGQDGVRGLYAGMSPNIVGAGAAWGLYFFFYNKGKSYLQDGDKNKAVSAVSHLATASVAGVLTLSLTNPIWVIKTRLCLQSASSTTSTASNEKITKYKGIIDALIKIRQAEGVRGLYRGFVPGLFGVSHGAIQFGVYEEMKEAYLVHKGLPLSAKLGNMEYLFFAATSKLVAAFTTYPYQVVRARLQDQALHYAGTVDCVRQTYRGEGIVGFYKGLLPNLLRVVPATMITFVVYENVSRLLQKQQSQSQLKSTTLPVSTPSTSNSKSSSLGESCEGNNSTAVSKI